MAWLHKVIGFLFTALDTTLVRASTRRAENERRGDGESGGRTNSRSSSEVIGSAIGGSTVGASVIGGSAIGGSAVGDSSRGSNATGGNVDSDDRFAVDRIPGRRSLILDFWDPWDEHSQAIESFRTPEFDRYRKFDRITGTDRAAAEAAVSALYASTERTKPIFFWFESPAAAIMPEALWSFRDRLLAPGRLLYSPFGRACLGEPTNRVQFGHGRYLAPFDYNIIAAAFISLQESLQVLSQIDAWLPAWQLMSERLQIEAPHFSDDWEKFIGVVASLRGSEFEEMLRELSESSWFIEVGGTHDAEICAVLQHCRWWRPYEDVCFMIERPNTLPLDVQDRLDGKAFFSDGFGVFALQGVEVEERIVDGAFTAQEIDNERNIERRRVMITKYGAGRYLTETNAEVMHEDECGILYRKLLPNSGWWEEAIFVVRVINSTAEPDGSFKEYFLRVPPDVNTAREAVAWTFGMTESEYKPAKET